MNRVILFAIIILSLLSPSAYAGTIELPKTGQTTSYATGDDGELQMGATWPEPRFTNDNGSTPITGDVVVDQLTGLMWTRDANLMPGRDPGWDNDYIANDGRVTWKHALDYVTKLNNENYQGYSDWRLPNINELESLINAEMTNPATWLNGQGFSNVQSYPYWSSSTWAVYFEFEWFVDMSNGEMSLDGNSYNYFANNYVWPVRSGQCGPLDNSTICLPKSGEVTSYYAADDGALQKGVAWPSPRFVENDDGTVLDKLTGLMWTKDANLPGSTKTWPQALDYVAAMNSGSGAYNYTDWRLPNRKEMRSLIDYAKHSPSLPQGHPFINVQWDNYPSDRYWSATTYPYDTDYAWYVSIGGGIVFYYNKSESCYVWPVRAGQCAPLTDWDNDTVCNGVDNCPDDYNPQQQDCDGDGTGDACDPDTIDLDGDGIDQACDICWATSNPGQQDTNGNCPAPPYTTDPKCGDACNVCMADFDNNGKTNLTDLGTLKSEFGRTNCRTVPPACEADTNADGKVNLTDLGKLKSEFGKTNCFQ